MTNVMTNAWDIAYKGQNKFGGKVKEYFAQALRMAWALFKKGGNNMKIELDEGSSRRKSYVAVIKGLDDQYGFDREFISYKDDEDADEIVAILEEGKVYEIQECGDREYVIIKNGKQVELEKEEITPLVKTELDCLLERFKEYSLAYYHDNKDQVVKKFGNFSTFHSVGLKKVQRSFLENNNLGAFDKMLTKAGF